MPLLNLFAEQILNILNELSLANGITLSSIDNISEIKNDESIDSFNEEKAIKLKEGITLTITDDIDVDKVVIEKDAVLNVQANGELVIHEEK